jgi:hypothetical protein
MAVNASHVDEFTEEFSDYYGVKTSTWRHMKPENTVNYYIIG